MDSIEIVKCRSEQLRAAGEYLKSDGNKESGGPALGISDWMLEEIEIMEEKKLGSLFEIGDQLGNKGLSGSLYEISYQPGPGDGNKPIFLYEPMTYGIQHAAKPPLVRTFDSGATRSSDEGKPDFEGFLSPLVMERYGEYMHKHRLLPDGSLRASDNWQAGIPLGQLVKSGWRHFMDWWGIHRGFKGREELEDSICALIFNASAYLHAKLRERNYRT